MKRLLITVSAASFVFGCDGANIDVDVTVPLEAQHGASQEITRDECPSGELDPTFGGERTGIARLSIKPDDAGGFFALERSDDGIVAAGHGIGGLGGSSFKVARLRSNGTPIPSFGGDGMVATSWGASTANYAFARAVGRQRDGKVVAIGWFEKGSQQDVALTRYDVDGELDGAFSCAGKPLVDLGGAEVIEGGLVTDDDSILAVGRRDEQLLVARFSPEGVLDTSFGCGTGYFTANVGDSSTATSVVLDGDGRIVVTGSATTSGQVDVLLVRLTPAGELDTSFGFGGQVLARDSSGDERGVAVAVAQDGGIVVGGDFVRAEPGSDPGGFLVRKYLPDGRPDDGFGVSGVARATVTDGADRAEGMTLAGGDILVVGNSSGGSADGPVLVRFTEAGPLRRSFGSCGVLSVDLGDYGVAHTIVATPGRRVLIGGGDEGASPGPGTYAVIARMCL